MYIPTRRCSTIFGFIAFCTLFLSFTRYQTFVAYILIVLGVIFLIVLFGSEKLIPYIKHEKF